MFSNLLLARLAVSNMSEADLIAYRRSLVNRCGFCGLRPVHRILMGV